MRTFAVAVTCAILVLSVVTGGWAKDIVSMPETDMMRPGQFELAYIYWDTDEAHLPGGATAMEHANVVEFFMGLTDRLEVDVIHVNPQGHFDTDAGDPFDTKTEINLYYKLYDETEKWPRVVVGATNITGSDWLPSHDSNDPDGDRRVSPFVITSKVLRRPKHGPPNWDDPAVKLQLGYGVNYHGDHWFGILQVALTPNVVVAWQHYRDQPGWLVGWNDEHGWGVHIGALGGDPWIHVCYDVKLSSLHF